MSRHLKFTLLVLQLRVSRSAPVWVGPHHGKYYTLVTEPATWYVANATGCPDGGHLASITYDNKAFLSKQLSIIDTDYFWIGLRSDETQFNAGTEFAVDVDYTNWERMSVPEPNGHLESGDDCVRVTGFWSETNLQAADIWADVDCDESLNFICQTGAQVRRLGAPGEMSKTGRSR